jgi:hypothetical protein
MCKMALKPVYKQAFSWIQDNSLYNVVQHHCVKCIKMCSEIKCSTVYSASELSLEVGYSYSLE